MNNLQSSADLKSEDSINKTRIKESEMKFARWPKCVSTSGTSNIVELLL